MKERTQAGAVIVESSENCPDSWASGGPVSNLPHPQVNENKSIHSLVKSQWTHGFVVVSKPKKQRKKRLLKTRKVSLQGSVLLPLLSLQALHQEQKESSPRLTPTLNTEIVCMMLFLSLFVFVVSRSRRDGEWLFSNLNHIKLSPTRIRVLNTES